MLDTCVLLDISTKKSGYHIVSAIEALTLSGMINLVIPDIVITEFEKNKDEAANRTRKRLSHEFKQVKSVVTEFGNEQKEQAIEVLEEVSSRLPLLSEANYATISRVEALIAASLQIKVSEKAKIAAVQRGLQKKLHFIKVKTLWPMLLLLNNSLSLF